MLKSNGHNIMANSAKTRIKGMKALLSAFSRAGISNAVFAMGRNPRGAARVIHYRQYIVRI